MLLYHDFLQVFRLFVVLLVAWELLEVFVKDDAVIQDEEELKVVEQLLEEGLCIIDDEGLVVMMELEKGLVESLLALLLLRLEKSQGLPVARVLHVRP